MTKNWIFIAIYILFIAAITYLVGTLSEADKVQDFIASQKEIIEDDNLKLISTVIVANQNDGTEALIEIEPLFTESYLSTNFDVTVYIYSFVKLKGNNAVNSVAIMIRDLRLDTDDLQEDTYHDTLLKADIRFNQMVTVGETSKQEFSEVFATLYDDQTKLIIIDYDKLNGETPIEFESITIKYVLTNATEPNLVVLTNSDLALVSTDDKFDGTFDRDIKNVNKENIQLTVKYGLNNLTPNDNIFYDPSVYDQLQAKALGIYARNISIEFVFVAILTYFIFFHGSVVRSIKENKLRNKALIKAEIEKIEKK